MEARMIDRLAAAFLLVLMAVGSLVLWVGVPVGSLWAASRLSDSGTGHLLIALPLVPAAMIVWGTFLFWLNGLYLRVIGVLIEPEDPDEPPPRIRGPLEPMLVGSLVIAIVAFLVWFFAFAENPTVSLY
jgi:hypothetical protein